MMSLLKTALKVALPLLVLTAAWFGTQRVKNSSPEAQRRGAPPATLSVEATRLAPTDFPIVLRSQGTVRPTTQNTLVVEVTGAITELSDDFVVGGSFEAGDALVQIDERDYQIALTRAQASLSQADAALEEERAMGSQAAADWKQLQRRGEPTSLMLREPQQAAAQANRDAAAAEVQRARLDLARTRIVAPYAGRVLSTAVSNGQFVNRGGTIGVIHAIDAVDVSLPLTSRQLEFLDLPPDGKTTPDTLAPTVELETRVGSTTRTWTGRLVRSEGVDAATQQLNVIARVERPFEDAANPLRVGQYVNARVQGSVLKDVFVVPRAAVRDGQEVLVIDGENQLRRRAVIVAWTDEEHIAISEGLSDGDVLVTTPLATVADGTPVRATVDGIAPPPPQRGEGGKEGQQRPAAGASPQGKDSGEGRGEGNGREPSTDNASASDGAARGTGSAAPDSQRNSAARSTI